MSGGGEVRYARKEPGQESPRMPAWKREILERRKAKSGVSGAAATTENGAGGSPKRSHAEQAINGGSGGGTNLEREDANTGWNYSITAASQYFASNIDARPAAAEATARSHVDEQESLVLQESLGPLEENPFIKLEKERRRRQDRENAARPIQHILELYGNVPGIRTIRAENILIIESDPDYIHDGEEVKSPIWQQNGYSSVNDFLDRRGNAVTEIRAKEVVIYDTALSKSEENLSTLGRPNHKDPSNEAGEGQGMVSRILQKFDSNYGKLQKKSHSTENLLDIDGSASRRQRAWAKPQLDLMPKPRTDWVKSLGSRQSSSSSVLQSSLKQKAHSPVLETGSPQPTSESPKPVSSLRQSLQESADRGTAVTPRDKLDGAHEVTPEVPHINKVPSTQSHYARSESLSTQVLHTSSDFEIRPSPKPDLSLIPDRDTQARALANLRLNSKNSFTVIPKRRITTSLESVHTALPSPAKASPSHRVAEQLVSGVPSSHMSTPAIMLQKLKDAKKQEEKETPWPHKPHPVPSVATSPALPIPSQNLSPSPVTLSPPALTSPPSSPAVPSSPILSPRALSPDPSPPSPTVVTAPADHLPVTNIDDVEVEATQRVAAHSPLAPRRKGNTFTVVPKRRVEAEANPSSPETQQDASSDSSPGSTPPQVPYAQLGSLLKKRYPAVEEIEVIGGYLSLGKSCLSKGGSLGKKLKISFNESSLYSTYEYPSENSVWDSGQEADEDKREGKVTEEPPSMVGRIHIPQPSFTSSSTHTNSSNDLSNYIPKHSMDFSAWQEYKQEDSANKEEATSQQNQMTDEVMLTPADSSSLSDYSSEPALYF
ncbi:taperin [Syngnathoides biaculeatus]|uniref:taperin n=1 Tax=Syngnathoides biaculeatus TaxID=300417 RepID=UPI002ADD5DD6|nr:taperin [Syngnathoides biaculeatus]